MIIVLDHLHYIVHAVYCMAGNFRGVLTFITSVVDIYTLYIAVMRIHLDLHEGHGQNYRSTVNCSHKLLSCKIASMHVVFLAQIYGELVTGWFEVMGSNTREVHIDSWAERFVEVWSTEVGSDAREGTHSFLSREICWNMVNWSGKRCMGGTRSFLSGESCWDMVNWSGQRCMGGTCSHLSREIWWVGYKLTGSNGLWCAKSTRSFLSRESWQDMVNWSGQRGGGTCSFLSRDRWWTGYSLTGSAEETWRGTGWAFSVLLPLPDFGWVNLDFRLPIILFCQHTRVQAHHYIYRYNYWHAVHWVAWFTM